MKPETLKSIEQTKQFRKDLDEVLQRMKVGSKAAFKPRENEGPLIEGRSSRERSLAITKVQEAIMWLGMDLKAIDEEEPGSAPNPYPKSYDPMSPVVEKTADGLTL